MKVFLEEKDIPRQWYNIAADLPYEIPWPQHPAEKRPIRKEELYRIFARALVEQEFSRDRWIDIPDEIVDVLLLWRPTPLVRAVNLEKALKTPARIYYKDESRSPSGSHKPNTAVAQAYYNKVEGIEALTTETGAGQWGSALSFACARFGLKCKVFMVRVSYEQKPYRRILMQLWGSEVIPSPSTYTDSGKSILEQDSNSPGSLGIAISEAVEVAVKSEGTRYTLGSVLNHVLLHQTIIGLETKRQLQMLGETADIVIGCVGGGSNFAGIVFPFVADRFKGVDMRFVAVEPKACPTLTNGEYRYDFGDTACMTPLLKMFTLGHKFIPSPIHAGGLRYHGMAPLVSLLKHHSLIDAVAYDQKEVFDAARLFAMEEGIIPAPESAHAIKAAIDEAILCKKRGKSKAIVFLLSGHGFFDLSAYDKTLLNNR